MLILKQSTSIDIRMGVFVDVTDGATPETGITIGAADQAEVLKANGAATVAMGGTFAAVTGADGWYDYTVAAGDVDTVGEVVFVMQDVSVCLPVYTRAYVVEEAVYDAMYGAASAGPLQSTTAARKLDVTATGAAGIDWANVENQGTAVDLSGTDIQLADTVTTLTNLPAITSNWLTAAGINAGALNGKGDWNVGKTGYSLTQAFPTNFADMSITVTAGLVDITQTAADKVWGTAARLLTAGTNIALAKGVGLTGLNDIAATEVVSAGAITTLTGAVVTVNALAGHTAQTGDSFARLGAAGAGLTDITLNAASINLFWDEAMVETTGAPAITGTFRAGFEWMFALSRNKITQTATLQTLRNDADGADLATSVVSDDATTYVRNEWSV